MTYILDKTKLPQIQYVPITLADGTRVMVGVGELSQGMVVYYPVSGEIIFAPAKELVELAVAAPREEPEEPKPTKKPLREVKQG